MTPSIGNIIQGYVSGRPFAYGSAIGQAMGPVGLAAGGGQYLLNRQIDQPTRAFGQQARVAAQEAISAGLGSIQKRVRG